MEVETGMHYYSLISLKEEEKWKGRSWNYLEWYGMMTGILSCWKVFKRNDSEADKGEMIV